MNKSIFEKYSIKNLINEYFKKNCGKLVENSRKINKDLNSCLYSYLQENPLYSVNKDFYKHQQED